MGAVANGAQQEFLQERQNSIIICSHFPIFLPFPSHPLPFLIFLLPYCFYPTLPSPQIQVGISEHCKLFQRDLGQSQGHLCQLAEPQSALGAMHLYIF